MTTSIWANETQEETLRRLAWCACTNIGVCFRGVQNGFCYFEVYLTERMYDGPTVTLCLLVEGTTEKAIQQRIRDWEKEHKYERIRSGTTHRAPAEVSH